MNLYIRYFEDETLVHSVDEALAFISALPELVMSPELEASIRDYVASDMFYPKRYKVRPRAYFILIKTTAETMLDFKQKKALNPVKGNAPSHKMPVARPQQLLTDICEGWYDGQLDFKRVILVPQTGKFEYKDTHVEYQCKAVSGQDCYNRIIEYLRERVDSRSQFPSAKGKNFHFTYLGKWK